MNRCLAALPTDFRAIALKDMRVFLRDPVQWSQVLVFFGLLALYFVNLRSFRYHALPEVWRNLIAFLNLFSISAVLCSLSSRFIYPQLSLEGQAYWLIGLAPTTPARVLTAKFGLALTSMLAVSAGLTWLSTTMLNVPLATRLASLALAVAISLASTGLSIGLGAVFLDLKQRNPAAIVSGCGGTLSLVLGLGFMLAVILPFGALSHSNAIGMLSPRTFHVGMMLAGLWLAVCTAAFSGLPLWIGSRSMSRREF
jgi:ABC-2 type transport system permease protein